MVAARARELLLGFCLRGAVSPALSRDGSTLFVVDRESHRVRQLCVATRLVRTLAGCASPTDGAEAPPHSFDMPPEAERHAQEDFVRCRKTDRSLQAEDMHRWLTMARLLALSYGETKLTEARWAQMKSFETQRKARIPPAPEG